MTGQWKPTRLCYCTDQACRYPSWENGERIPPLPICPSTPADLTQPHPTGRRLWMNAWHVDDSDERLPHTLFKPTKKNGWVRNTYLNPEQWTDKDFLSITGKPRPKDQK